MLSSCMAINTFHLDILLYFCAGNILPGSAGSFQAHGAMEKKISNGSIINISSIETKVLMHDSMD